ncbi:hypothetical protein LWI29_037314 [Acer saccharum]|uniref:Retrovirus-related Pol polyprotein from transposon TNT 1-94-like beta-barrel domain-containing protein n=1 Tax=Acer saccharum TaxID=4024 RepID=A0AA39SB92_ACESA|nr:hypothetical protein LWI29_037314 [Acer saccharum]
MDLNMKSVESNNNCAPKRFSGQNFKRWQARMKFWLTTLGLFSVIDAPSIPDSEEEPGRTHALKVPKKQDYLCHGKICSRLEDNLFDIYYQIPSAHDIWYALEKKYSTEDAGLEKYHVDKECYQRKGKKGKSIEGQVHVTIGGDSTALGGGYVSYFPEVNMVYQSNEWWIDSGANVHVCANRSAFVSYQESDGRVTKGDASVAQVCGQVEEGMDVAAVEMLIVDVQ